MVNKALELAKWRRNVFITIETRCNVIGLVRIEPSAFITGAGAVPRGRHEPAPRAAGEGRPPAICGTAAGPLNGPNIFDIFVCTIIIMLLLLIISAFHCRLLSSPTRIPGRRG
jgi:hypothetical protein